MSHRPSPSACSTHLVVLTGANRVRGTTTAAAASKHSMALPMAVSSWNTGALELSRGLTVFLFLISGRAITPPLADRVAWEAVQRSRQE